MATFTVGALGATTASPISVSIGGSGEIVLSGEVIVLVSLVGWALALSATYWRMCQGGRIRRLADAPPLHRAATGTPPIEVPVLMELLGAALGAGAPVPRGLQATGEAIGGSDGLSLSQVGAALRLGATWSEAWQNAPTRLQLIGQALRPAWEDGAAPRETLRAASEDLRRTRRDNARIAAEQLAVQLVLPLGLCLLPAFVLLGLMPVVLSLGVNLLAG